MDSLWIFVQVYNSTDENNANKLFWRISENCNETQREKYAHICIDIKRLIIDCIAISDVISIRENVHISWINSA